MSRRLFVYIGFIDDETGEQGYRDSAMNINGADNKTIEDIALSAAKQHVREVFNIPTPVNEGGRG